VTKIMLAVAGGILLAHYLSIWWSRYRARRESKKLRSKGLRTASPLMLLRCSAQRTQKRQ
jgi:hypothetical protein